MRWWRVFIDKLSRKGDDASAVTGPRRRKAERYDFRARLSAKCSSWPKFLELFTSDVSNGGLFVPTMELANVGETVNVDLSLPDGSSFAMTGTVVNVIGAEQAAKLGKRPGLGIQLDDFEGEAKERFDALLLAARAAQPIPETVAHSPLAAVTETGSLRTSAVLQAIADGSLQDPFASSDGEARPVASSEPADPEPARARPITQPPPIPTARPTPRPTARPTPRPTARPTARSRAREGTGPIVGIDLGTTYTSIAAVQGKKVTILERDDQTRSSPSVIAFPSKDEVLIGSAARERIATDPAHTVVSPKRLLGRKFTDREVQTFVDQAAYRTLEGPDGTTIIEMWQQPYAVPQLLSYILSDARDLAEKRLGEKVTRAVISVPISFDDKRLSALRRAAEMARLDIVALIDEPSAAALANRFAPNFGGTVGVYDFGGGTFDFSVVDVSQGDFRVMATAGDTWLGGDDFDQVLAEAAANQFWRQHKVDLRNQAVEWQRLLFACERAKRSLSIAESAVIQVADVLRTAQGMVDLNLSIDRATLKRACSAIIQRSLDTCSEALSLLDMKPNELTAVYLSGGTTYIPAVREALSTHFGVPVRTGVPPEHAVCLGAAIHAAQLQFRGDTVLDER